MTDIDTPKTLMDEPLIDYTKRMFREACTAWSDIRDKNGIIHEDKCQYASAIEGYAKGAIDRWKVENDTLRTQLAQAQNLVTSALAVFEQSVPKEMIYSELNPVASWVGKARDFLKTTTAEGK